MGLFPLLRGPLLRLLGLLGLLGHLQQGPAQTAMPLGCTAPARWARGKGKLLGSMRSNEVQRRHQCQQAAQLLQDDVLGCLMGVKEVEEEGSRQCQEVGSKGCV